MPNSTARLADLPEVAGFEVELDQRAEQWLAENMVLSPIVITFSVTRCCGGTRVCDVRLQVKGLGALCHGRFVRIDRVADRDVLMDDRILKTMSRRIPITVYRLLGQSRLSLDLSGEQWARLLYA
jgi:hypothetical protein